MLEKKDLENNTITFQNIEIMYKSLMKAKASFNEISAEEHKKMSSLQDEINEISKKMSEVELEFKESKNAKFSEQLN